MSLLNETVELLGMRLDLVDTIHEAVIALRCCHYEVIITAVSTSLANLFDESLFDERTCQLVYKSHLLQQAIRESPSTYRIIYGYEAMEFEDVRCACFECGADAVVNSSETLFTALFGFLTPPPTNNNNNNNNAIDRHCQMERDEQLLQLAGGFVTRRLQTQGVSMTMTTMTPHNHRIEEATNLVPCPQENLSSTNHSQTDSSPTLVKGRTSDQQQEDYSVCKSKVFRAPGTGAPSLRVVHISDTLGRHRALNLPGGDILLHTGNFTNGKTATCLDQFTDFLDWIHEDVVPKYRQVVFIAGDRDFFLDIIACQYNAASREAQKILNRFLSRHKQVAFLENSSLSFRGITIHGSSTTLLKGSDDTEFNKNTKLGAFERKVETYVRPEINDECDILLTHRPPSHVFVQVPYVLPTDHLYRQVESSESDSKKKRVIPLFQKNKKNKPTSDLKTKKLPPRLHAFGHYGSGFGADERLETLLLNGSQDRILRDDKHGGGIPLSVDLPLSR